VKRILFRLIPAVPLAGVLLLAACSRQEAVVYDAPKDPPRDPSLSPFGAPAGPMGGMQRPAQPQPAPLNWVLPEGWHAVEASGARTAAFHAHAGAATADVVLVEFPAATDDAAFYAHLARQAGQEPGTGGFEAVQVGPHPARIARFATPAGEGLLAALVPVGERLWFAQVTGPLANVDAMRPSFEAFLASLVPAAAAPASTAAPATAAATPPGAAMIGQALPEGALGRGAAPSWSTPSHWGPGPASSMRRGSYRVDGAGGTTIDIAVTSFPGDVGGLLSNLNRWRSQIGLGPISPADMPSAATTLRIGNQTATWVDFAGTGERPQRTLVVQFQVAGESWFFKATGDAALVASEEPSFRSMVESVRFPSP